MKQTPVQDLVNKIAALEKRIYQLERLRAQPNIKITDLADTPAAAIPNANGLIWDSRKQIWVAQPPVDIVFSYSGTPSGTPPPYVPKTTITVTGMAVAVGTASAASSTFALQRNGTTILTATLAAESKYVYTPMPSSTVANFNARLDQMTITASPGSGLSNVVVTVELG